MHQQAFGCPGASERTKKLTNFQTLTPGSGPSPAGIMKDESLMDLVQDPYDAGTLSAFLHQFATEWQPRSEIPLSWMPWPNDLAGPPTSSISPHCMLEFHKGLGCLCTQGDIEHEVFKQQYLR